MFRETLLTLMLMSASIPGPARRTSLTMISVAAAAALALAACAPDDTAEEPAEDQADDQAVDETEDTATEDSETEAPEEDETTEEASPTEEETEEGGDDAGTSDEHPVFGAIDAAEQEYPDGVVTEFDHEGSYVEVYVVEGDTEWELDIDAETLEVISTDQDSVDSDDRQEVEAIGIDITEALQTAVDESGAQPHDAELDSEGGTVVWEFEMDNGSEVYVDVATGEVTRTS